MIARYTLLPFAAAILLLGGATQACATTLRTDRSQCYNYLTELLRSSNLLFAYVKKEKAGDGTLGGFVKSGTGSVDDAQFAAAREWASIAAPSGVQVSDGRISSGELSYYESPINRENRVSTNVLRAALMRVGGV